MININIYMPIQSNFGLLCKGVDSSIIYLKKYIMKFTDIVKLKTVIVMFKAIKIHLLIAYNTF